MARTSPPFLFPHDAWRHVEFLEGIFSYQFYGSKIGTMATKSLSAAARKAKERERACVWEEGKSLSHEKQFLRFFMGALNVDIHVG